MIRIYRILRRAYARAPFDGEGAYLYGGRWSSSGTRLSYASEHQSLAMLEYFVHLDKDDPPPDLVLAVAEIPETIKRERIELSRLPARWRDFPAPPELTKWGDEFASQARHCLLFVPSALAPHEWNCLLNPAHPDYKRIAVAPLEALSFDPRMFGPPKGRRRPRR